MHVPSLCFFLNYRLCLTMSQDEAKWTCNVCTYENWPKAVKCTICLSPKHSCLISQSDKSQDIYMMAPLISETCTNISAQSCTSSNPHSKWTCHACTFMNWPRSAKCTQCLSKKQVNLTPNSPVKKIPDRTEQSSNSELSDYYNERNKSWSRSIKWSCLSCTYENWPKSTKCVLCHTPRPKTEQSSQVCGDSDEGRIRTYAPLSDSNNSRVSPPMSQNQVNAASNIRRRTRPWCSETTDIHRENLFSILLSHSGVTRPAVKRVPSDISQSIASDIRHQIAASLKQRRGEFSCFFVTEFVTFSLPAEVEDFHSVVQERLFDELLDRDVQKELEEESPIINWSLELTERLGSRLYALWNRSTGDCLLDSALQATWGVFDRDNTLRRALGDSLCEAASVLYPRWKEAETLQAHLLQFSLDETQWQEDWATLLSLASQPGSALEQMHIFTLAHILRRPIIVYGVKYVKSFRGEALGYARFEGIYLPLLWEPTFCWKSPIALGYTRGHFSALVAMEPETEDVLGAGANNRSAEELQVAFLPLMTADCQRLPIHFLTQQELGREEEILRQWMDCCVTEGNILVAQQQIPKRPHLVSQMIEEWLDFYRSLTHRSQSPTSSASPPESRAQVYSSDGDSD